MKQLKTSSGWIAYRTTAIETTLIGGLVVCDECNDTPPVGYLVPVLNHWQCPTCFEKWQSRARYYESDKPFETRNAAYYESVIPLESEP